MVGIVADAAASITKDPIDPLPERSIPLLGLSAQGRALDVVEPAFRGVEVVEKLAVAATATRWILVILAVAVTSATSTDSAVPAGEVIVQELVDAVVVAGSLQRED